MDTDERRAGFTPTDDQRRVVEHAGGPLLVLGGPGTGKSTVLKERWLRLAAEAGPHRVLLLVPDRDRAAALRDELALRMPARAMIEVPVHSWYAMAHHLVTRYHRLLGFVQSPVLLTGPEQWASVRDLLLAEDPSAWGPYADHLTTTAFVDEVADFCLRAGHRAASGDEVRRLPVPDDQAPVVAFLDTYRTALEEGGRVDYPSMVCAAARLLAEHDDVREQVHTRFPHVLVDDAHELTPAQLELLRRLTSDDLVCAADPDSAIEAFRGADPGWLTRVDEVMPGHATVVLPVSMRFGPRLGAAAARLIAHAPQEHGHRPSAYGGPDTTVELVAVGTMAGEIDAVAREVRSAHLLSGVPYERMAILLAQSGRYLAPLRRALEVLGVPARTDSAGRPLSEEPAVHSFLDLARAALQGADDELLAGVLTSAFIGCEPDRVRALRRQAFAQDTRLSEQVETDGTPACAEYRRLRDVLLAMEDEPADAGFQAVFDASAWCAGLVAARGRDGSADAHLRALTGFMTALGRFAERRPDGTLRTYLGSSGAASFAPEPRAPSQIGTSGVHVGSLHGAKGREWDVVCIVGASEGLLPRSRPARGLFDPWALEGTTAVDRALASLAEERRTFYVALTRARGRVLVTHSPGPSGRSVPSRFLEEAFGAVPEPVPPPAPVPLTLREAEASFRRTIASRDAGLAAKAAAACALGSVPGVDPSAWWWRRDWTPGAPLAPDGKLVTSYSRIGTYDNCPLQYVLKSVLGLDPETTYQMKFGSLLHKVIEETERGEITKLDDALARFKEGFNERDYPNLPFARTYYRAGRRMIRLWWGGERTRNTTVAVEYAFDDLDVDGHTIRGRIDRVSVNGGGLVLSDYKTSARPASFEDVRTSLQLSIYYQAAVSYDDLKRHGTPVAMELVYPAKEDSRAQGFPVRRVQKPEEARENVDRLRVILAEAADERFHPSPSADCQWCRMKPLCPRWPEGGEVGP